MNVGQPMCFVCILNWGKSCFDQRSHLGESRFQSHWVNLWLPRPKWTNVGIFQNILQIGQVLTIKDLKYIKQMFMHFISTKHRKSDASSILFQSSKLQPRVKSTFYKADKPKLFNRNILLFSAIFLEQNWPWPISQGHTTKHPKKIGSLLQDIHLTGLV